MRRKIYLAVDAHARRCVLGHMNSRGQYLGDCQFPTEESELIRHVVRIEAQKKVLAVEESPLAYWIAQTLKPYVAEVLICDPRENAAIASSPIKKDQQDTYQLCRLLRLGELKHVYHPVEDHRAIFKAAVQQYLDLRAQQVRVKQKLKAKYQGWGVTSVEGTRVYGADSRVEFLRRAPQGPIRSQLRRLYELMDEALALQQSAWREVQRLGSRYPEIGIFQKIPGVGRIGAHIFDAYVQTPQRFTTKQRLWRYCQLGIRDRSSDGKPLGFKRLDKSGNSELKAMSYHCWLAALQTSNENEVRRFYRASLNRTHSRTHARLNTQRKILATMWGLWKNQEDYSPEQFCPSDHS